MLNPDKCTFLQRELEYLGHEITPEGIKPLKRNVEKVINFPAPQNKKKLERFIGLASYYRKGYSPITMVNLPLGVGPLDLYCSKSYPKICMKKNFQTPNPSVTSPNLTSKTCFLVFNSYFIPK